MTKKVLPKRSYDYVNSTYEHFPFIIFQCTIISIRHYTESTKCYKNRFFIFSMWNRRKIIFKENEITLRGNCVNYDLVYKFYSVEFQKYTLDFVP